MDANDPDEISARLAELRPKLHRYCARMVGSFLEGEDVVQDTFLKALQALRSGFPVERLESWAFSIAHNAAMDHLRRSRRRDRNTHDEVLMDMPDPKAVTDERYAAAVGMRAFLALPAAQRATVILMDVLGYSQAEIGEMLGMTLAATKANLNRARAALREIAGAAGPVKPVALSDRQMRLTQRYVDLFNARDFDAIRDMLSEDVRLSLIARNDRAGRGQVERYFTNYDSIQGWRLRAGIIEDRPAIFVSNSQDEPDYLVLVDWSEERISLIRDFKYAGYRLDGADAHVFR
jgi:RNA polymerase sigma-70 factor (ECF subfamily)